MDMPEKQPGQAKATVLAFITAINELDFETVRRCLLDDFKFEGVLGSRDGADAYLNDMKKMQLKYSVLKAVEEGNDVAVFYDILMAGKKIFCCGWYQLSDEKISSLKVVFDPRPVLQG